MEAITHLKIPGYRIDKMLGKGGMATVYLATQMSLGRPVSLKILNDPETPQFFERFFNEGRCVARLSHSNLVTIYDIGQGEGFYYIAMEYLPGGDLKARIAQGMKPGPALKILSRLASCLGYVHSQGLIHRDIKPSNILFRADGTPVLADFGIAKLMQTDNDLTVTGTVMGSPHYLSPEQAQGNRRLDGRSDLYSLGVVLFEMLAGRKPYTAESFAATLMAHIKKPIPRLPQELSRYQPLLDRLLAKKPEQRFQSGTELNQQIQHLRNRNRVTEDGSEGDLTRPRGAPGYTGSTVTLRQRLSIGVILLAALPLGWSMLERDPPAAVGDEKPTTIRPMIQAIPMMPALPAMPPPDQLTLSNEDIPPLEELVIEAEKQQLDQAALWLEMAEARLQEDRLSLPRGDSARDYFNKVLRLQPDNAKAMRGLELIADRYVLFARKRLNRGQYPKARRFINQGLATIPGHRELEDLSLQLDLQLREEELARQQTPAQILPQQAPPPVAKSVDPFRQLTPENDN